MFPKKQLENLGMLIVPGQTDFFPPKKTQIMFLVKRVSNRKQNMQTYYFLKQNFFLQVGCIYSPSMWVHWGTRLITCSFFHGLILQWTCIRPNFIFIYPLFTIGYWITIKFIVKIPLNFKDVITFKYLTWIFLAWPLF